MKTPLPESAPPPERYPKTAWIYLREGLARAHRRRPISFYLLLAMPVVLVLTVGLLDRANVKQFGFSLGLLFLFFGVVMIRAVSDIFDITRYRLRNERASFRDTLGEPDFAASLGENVKKAQEE